MNDIMSNDEIFENCTEDSTNLLAKDEGPTIKASTVISILDDISNDPNIPIHARILVWNILSELEAVKD